MKSILFAAWLLVSAACWAADRPFLLTNSAAAEEDDDNAWSVETAWTRIGSTRSISVAPEYAFSPTDSLQFEMTRSKDRSGGGRVLAVELEAKHLFNHIDRDGWGIGVVAALGAARQDGQHWRSDSLDLRLPVSWKLGESGSVLHLNLGVEKPRGERRLWGSSIALEVPLPGRLTAFAEAGRGGGERLVHGGARWWLKREKLALDVSLLRLRGGGERHSGALIGVGWYDL